VQVYTRLKCLLLASRRRRITALLAKEHELPYGEVVSRLAELLYRNELRAGGSAVDIGLFGRSLFAWDARRALEAGNGELWNIDRP
jgi:hypothetical protein